MKFESRIRNQESRNILSRFSLISILLLLSGCILVDDFAPLWGKGVTDSCVTKIAEGLYYNEFRRDPEGKNIAEHAKSFRLGDKYFLMLKKAPEDAGGRTYRFGVVNGIFQRYRLDPVMRDAFQIEFPDAAVDLSHDTVRLNALGEKEMALLKEISSRTEYWEIEDQTLYNTMLNPLCQFDDRNVKALIEENKPKAKK